MVSTRFLVPALLALTLAGIAESAEAACLSRGEGRNLMMQGQVIPLPEALRRAGLQRREVVDAQLCEGGGGFVYRIRVLEEDGRLRPIDIPAN